MAASSTTLTRTVHSAGIPASARCSSPTQQPAGRRRPDPPADRGARDRSRRPPGARRARWSRSRVDQPYTAAVEAELEQGRQLAGATARDHRARGRRRRPRLHRAPADHAGGRGRTSSSTLTDDKIVAHQRRPRLAGRRREGLDRGRLRRGHARLRHAAASASAACPRRARTASSPTASSPSTPRAAIKGSWLLTIAYDSDRKLDRRSRPARHDRPRPLLHRLWRRLAPGL